jgi:phosphohistidine phosphatase
MSLYLVQHAPAADKDTDPARGLTREGVATAERIAAVAAGYRVRVAGKRRARQTADILAAALAPPDGVLAHEGLDPHDDPVRFAPLLTGQQDVMIVGHLPFLSRLASCLVVGDPERPIFLFQRGGIVCLAETAPGQWAIQWTLMPHIGG